MRYLRPARAAQAWGECFLEEFLFVAFRGKTTGFLSGHEGWRFFGKVSMHMKLGFYVGKFSARTCIHIIPDLQYFCALGLFLVWPPPKKKQQTKIKSILWLEWLATKDSDDRSSIFLFSRSLCTLMTPNFAWTRRWRNKVCSTSAWYHGPGSLKYNMPGKSFHDDLNRTCEMKRLVLK